MAIAEELRVEVNCLLQVLLHTELAIPALNRLGGIVQHGGSAFPIAGMRIKVGITPERPKQMRKDVFAQKPVALKAQPGE